MTRLTNWLRNEIVEAAVVKSGIAAEFEKYEADREQWAGEMADASIGGPEVVALVANVEAKVQRAIKALPEDLRPDGPIVGLRGSLWANIAGCKVYISEFVGQRCCKHSVTLTADHPLAVRFFALEDREKEIEERRHALRTQVRAALNQVNTVAQLLKVWPEARELLPGQAAPAPQLPAVRAEELNALVGLPSEEEKAND